MRHAVPITVFSALVIMSVKLAGQTEDTLSLSFRSISFVRNNEYYSPVAEGYTLLGYFIQPELVFKTSDRLTLKLGANLLSYSGTGKFSSVRPLFSSTLKLTENSSFILGTLSGSDRHLMSDPLFHRERMYSHYSEDGLQFVVNNPNIFSDTWVSWENFIFKGGNDREIFTAGESFRYNFPLFSDFLCISVPLQLHVKHYGGQITDYPEPVETFFTASAGAGVAYDIAGSRSGRVFIDYFYFHNRQLNGAENSALIKGHANWIKTGYSFKGMKFEIGSWKGRNFYAPDGNPIFYSLSVFNHETPDDNNIITSGLFVNLSPESYFDLFFGFEGFYFTGSRRFDNSLSLHFSFSRLFRLAVLGQGR